jgi:fluoride ion exporter CrcB/FEX
VEDEEERALKRESRLYWVQACYIGLGAVLGALVRMILAQIFGENCANPGSIGWLPASSPLCVTAQGDISQAGGVLFADLPANMIGSFLMGLFQDGVVLGLALPMPLAWLPPTHPFQRMTALHTAFKTGFCGSLTTFSSWNSAMVVLIFGTGSNLPTQIWLALFGYIIGMETAMGSFVCGKSVARFLHRKMNPILANEAQAVRERHEEGVYIHWDLPDFERRFLSRLNMGDASVEGGEVNYPQDHLDLLERWRVSTEHIRRVRHPLLSAMLATESSVLCKNERPPKDVEAVARSEGMDVDSLLRWSQHVMQAQTLSRMPSFSSFSPVSPKDGSHPALLSCWVTLPVAAVLVWFAIFLACMGLVLFHEEEDAIVTYRTMSYSMLLAPVGALARWRLSVLNGTLSKYEWFFLGTFVANFVGSIVSITALAIEFHLTSTYRHPSFWTVGTLRALRIGVAGCLTTVSTFVVEVHHLMQQHSDHAYPYIWISLGASCAVSALIYGIIVYGLT